MTGAVQEATRPARFAPLQGHATITMPDTRPRTADVAGHDHRPTIGDLGSPSAQPWPHVVDALLAVLALIVLAPVLLLVATLVATTSRGPVFYRQRRYGQYGSTFQILKFRTMRVDAEQRLTELLATDDAVRAEYETTSKLRNDPRVTTIGRFLRRTSLDELPQLWNVVRGDMRLVGPRPLAHDFELRWYGDRVIDLLSVKPGVTGPFQVAGRNDLPVDRRVALELDYVRTLSPANDFRYLVRTLPVLTRPFSNGAC